MRFRSAGFTLVELLVVITIIGILISLLLPAVQSAREAARRMQCQNNLKQLGLACLNYESTFKIFPPASHWADLGPNSAATSMRQQNQSNLRENWVIMILPFLEQQPLYDAFDLSLPINNDRNAAPRSTRLSVMCCPSDPNNQTPYSGLPGSSQTSNHGSNWGRGNYGANGALGHQSDSAHCDLIPGINNGPDVGCAAKWTSWGDNRVRGVMGANASSTMADIRDGTSNTFLLLELRAGIVSHDVRGTWAMSGAGPSSCWAHGYVGDAVGPNCLFENSDDVAGCGEVHAAVGAEMLLRQRMPCYKDTSTNPNRQAGSRSAHQGGVFTCFADGSVHWISDNIQTSRSWQNPSVWDKLNLSADGLPISGSAY